ncbi:MAG: recombinase family protein [Candidatus Competibacteraceae bacterium]|nr:recombinase family protein [Candidatus Competibacteraceae bacterium]
MSPKREPTKVSSSCSKQAVMYVRVSSQEQEDEGYSTDAQERLIKEYAKKHGYKIIKTFEDVETAKRAGRSEFGKMIAFIEEQDGRCQHILAEKTDRIYRNIKDWVIIEDLGVDLHLVKEGKIISSTAPSNDKFHQASRC